MLEKAKKFVSEVAELVRDANEYSKTYSNPGDSCSYEEEFNKIQTNKDTKAGNAIRSTMDFFLDNEKAIEKSNNAAEFLSELKMLLIIRENFLKNFKKESSLKKLLA